MKSAGRSFIAVARSAVFAGHALAESVAGSAFTTSQALRETMSKQQPRAFVPPPPRFLLGLGIAGWGFQAVKMLRATE